MAQQNSSEFITKNGDMRLKVQKFVKQHFDGAMESLHEKREEARTAVSADLAAHGFGFALNPLDARFDEVEVNHCNAVLRAKADALFKAYKVYGLTADDLIWKELSSHRQQLVDARKNSLKHEAGARSTRTGRNPAPDLARAEALGQKIGRSTHAFLKSLACEIEERKHMPKDENRQHVTYNQTIYGNPTNVAQGESVTIANIPVNNVFTTIQASIENNLSDGEEKRVLLEVLESLGHARNKPSFLEKSNQFLAMAKSFVTLVPQIATWVPLLENFVKTNF